jgi:hypothetical protein
MSCCSSQCYPNITLSLCDSKVFLTAFNEDVTLFIYKGNSKVCSYELTPDNGEIFLTDLEILDAFNTYHRFKIYLKDSENNTIPLLYQTCEGQEEETDMAFVRFNDCDMINEELFEDCF